jgi:hypothetical protein
MSDLGAICIDCGTETLSSTPGVPSEFYMVHDAVWAAAGGPAVADMESYLCIGCIEARLGRQLTAADFTGAPVNSLSRKWRRYAWWWRTERLRGRLTAPSSQDDVQLTLWRTS